MTNDKFAQTFHEALSLRNDDGGFHPRFDGVGGPEYYGALALAALLVLYTWMNGDN